MRSPAVTAPPGAPARPATMRAAVLDGPRSWRLERVPVPEPGPGELLLRVEGCGVCGSNVPVWTGASGIALPLAPGEPGHEIWGTVERLGPGAAGPAPGTRAVALSYHGFAEHDVASADTVVPLPSALDGVPVPGEALACAVNVLRRAEVRAGEPVALVGAGFLGLLLGQLCARRGVPVVALSRRPFSLELAEGLGARPAASVEEALALNGGEGFARVIEAGGTQETLDLASALAGVHGRLVLAGYHQGGPRTIDLQSWNWRGLDVVNAHERDADARVRGLREAVELAAARELDLEPLVTHRLPLSRLGEALALAEERPAGFVKAVVCP